MIVLYYYFSDPMNHPNRLALLAALTPLFASTVLATSARADISTSNWLDFRGSQETCLQIAAETMKDLQMTNVVSNQNIVSGARGGYAATIRCISQRNMAFIFVHGPSGDVTDSMVTATKATFERNAIGRRR
jgi:hypothetical protein